MQTIYFFIVVLGRGYIVAFAKVLTMYQIYLVEFTPTLLFFMPLIPGIVSTGIIFAFTYRRTQFLHHIHPPTTFPCHLPLPLVPPPISGQNLFYPPIL
jgi:hypothetical protein